MRVLFLLAALVLLATFAPLSLQRVSPPPATSWVAFEPVPLDEAAPGTRRLGGLDYLGGWRLASNDYRFGGISALHVEEGEALAFADAGWRIRFRVPSTGHGRGTVSIERVRQGPPGALDDKSNRDIEAAAVAADEVWLAYEQVNEVWRYGRSGFTRRSSAQPAAIAQWHENRGAEAMVRLDDGRFLVFAEGSGGDSDAVLFAADPSSGNPPATRFKYRPPDGYRVTDAARLPDGRLLFLNRRFGLLEGFTAILTIAALPEIHKGAILEGRTVAAFAGSVTKDNLEALSATNESGRTIVWIASDDNYNPLQRTLLLKFALRP